MEILTEADLRAARVSEGAQEYHVKKGVFITPLAREYLRDRHIRLCQGEEAGPAGMPQTPIPDRGAATYVDARTGRGYAEKPERMTHLSGNRLVMKSDPRIAFRGKLDTLQAGIILAQTQVECRAISGDLEEVLLLVRAILSSEVKEQPLGRFSLFGLDERQLRYQSQHVGERFSMDHPVPAAAMGGDAAWLNLLRTQSREAELAGEAAFAPEAGRDDLLQALNRLSSGLYLMFCRLLAGEYGGGTHEPVKPGN